MQPRHHHHDYTRNIVYNLNCPEWDNYDCGSRCYDDHGTDASERGWVETKIRQLVGWLARRLET